MLPIESLDQAVGKEDGRLRNKVDPPKLHSTFKKRSHRDRSCFPSNRSTGSPSKKSGARSPSAVRSSAASWPASTTSSSWQRAPLHGAVAKASNVTINDVVLALCPGALRRYLIEHQSLPDLPLTAAVPASLRAARAAAHQSLAANRRSGSFSTGTRAAAGPARSAMPRKRPSADKPRSVVKGP